jgi:hypothetical protein
MVDVHGICGKYLYGGIISLHHIALHNIRGYHRLLAVTVLVQYHMLPEERYDVASYYVGYGAYGHAYALHLRFTCIEVGKLGI